MTPETGAALRELERRLLVSRRQHPPTATPRPFTGRDVLRRLQDDIAPVWLDWPARIVAKADPYRITIVIEAPS